MITIRDLNAGYGAKLVLNNLDWQLQPSMIHGLAGLNGSGKTTLMKCIFGLIKPLTGSITIEGKPISKKVISLLETEPYFYHGITGSEYLSLFKPEGNFTFTDDEWATLFHLPLGDLIDNYSTGMKKKLAILGNIKMNKKMMLLDEPFNGLDLESTRVLTTVLKRICESGKTIIITSHVLESLTNLCDEIHYLKNGVIEKTYLPSELSVMNREIFHELDQHIEKQIDGLLKY